MISHSQNITEFDEDIFIAAKQVSQEVLGTYYEEVDDHYTYLDYNGDEFSFELDNHRLVKSPGFEIMLTNIDDLSFEIKNQMIYMNIVREKKDYQFLLTFVREKEMNETDEEQ